MALANWVAEYHDAADRNSVEAMRSDMRYGACREGVQCVDENMQPIKEEMTPEEGLRYIAFRRGAEHFTENDRDGLFNARGKADVEKECAMLGAHPDSIEWRAILSFKKEDLVRSGYNSPLALQQLLTEVMPDIGRAHGISPENLVWNAAYHPIDKRGKDHHPHVHVYFYSTDPTEGRMSKEHTVHAFKKARSAIINTVFADETQEVQLLGREARQALRAGMTALQSDPQWLEDSGTMTAITKLKEQLPTSGKMQYGYLPSATKKTVDGILRQLISSPLLSPAYEQLVAAQRQYVEAYNDDEAKIDKRMQEWEKHFFHPTAENDKATLHNMIIRMAASLDSEEEYTPVENIPTYSADTTATPSRRDVYIAELADKALAGNAVAMYRLGCMLQYGDPKKAERLLNAACAKGVYGAFEKVARKAEDAGDIDRAVHLYEQAAMGDSDTAMYRLGKLYERGAGKLIANADMAQMWYERAAAHGNLWATVRLATKYDSEEHIAKAIDGLELHIRESDHAALFLHRQLGALYEKEQDYPSAIYEYATARSMPECAAALVRMSHDEEVYRAIASLSPEDKDVADAAAKILTLAQEWEEAANAAKHDVLTSLRTAPEQLVPVADIKPGTSWYDLSRDQQDAVRRVACSIVKPNTPYIRQQISNAVLYAHTQNCLRMPLKTSPDLHAAFNGATAELREFVAHKDTSSPAYKTALHNAVEATKTLHPNFTICAENNPKQYEHFVERQAEHEARRQANQQKMHTGLRSLALSLLSAAGHAMRRQPPPKAQDADPKKRREKRQKQAEKEPKNKRDWRDDRPEI